MLTIARLLALVFALMPLIPAGEASAEVFDPADYYELVITLEPGTDPIDFADYFLGQLEIEYADHKAERVHHIEHFPGVAYVRRVQSYTGSLSA